MNKNPIQQIAVVGAGLMGHGIALDFALAGFGVNLHDLNEQRLRQANEKIQGALQFLAAAGRILPGQIEAVAHRIKGCDTLQHAVARADLVIESVFEDLALKQSVFKEVEALCPAHAILASNTSSFPPTLISAPTQRPEKVLVAHYFNPPYLLPLVEIVKGAATDDDTVSAVFELLTLTGKKPVVLKKEALGFIANRLQAALVREALAIVERGIADPEEVDTVLQNSIGRRLAVMGVFESLDLVGLDLAVAVATALLPDLDASCQLTGTLRAKVERKELGAKTGQGFYSWTPESVAARSRAIAQALSGIARLSESAGG